MFALVFWMRSKTKSVIKEDDLIPIKEEGNFTHARYNGKLYQVKIVKKSG